MPDLIMERKAKKIVIIEQCSDFLFNVTAGDKKACFLTYDEMLGLTSAIFLPEDRPCINWLEDRNTESEVE